MLMMLSPRVMPMPADAHDALGVALARGDSRPGPADAHDSLAAGRAPAGHWWLMLMLTLSW